MSLIKPRGYSISAFDATNDYTFKFIVSGGDLVTKNTLIIKDNDTLAEVYRNTVDTYAFSQTVVGGTLTNNKSYNYSFITYNSSNEQSLPSESIQFYCYTTPTLSITNFPSSNVINTSNFEFTATYNQVENEKIQYGYFVLYDISGTTVETSPYAYNKNSSNPPFTFSHTFGGMLNGSQYKIKAIAQTVNGTIVETELKTFTIRYTNPKLFSLLELENNELGGYVKVVNNVKLIEGESNPYPPTYIDGNSIDVTNKNSWVKWSQGYKIENDFTLKLWVNRLNLGAFLEMSNDNNEKIVLSIDMQESENISAPSWNEVSTLKWNEKTSLVWNGGKVCCFLRYYDKNGNLQYITKSNCLDFVGILGKTFVWIRKVDNLFDAKMEVLTQ